MNRTEEGITITDQQAYPLMSIGQQTCDRSSDTEHIFKHRADLHNDCLIFTSSYAIHTNAFKPSIECQQTPEIFIYITMIRFCSNFILLHTTATLSMDATEYWPMAREYSIWNANITSLQFWTEDLDPVILGRATECVYTTFFYSPSSHTLCQQSDEILFGHFVIALNAAFDQELSLTDEGYESGSDTIDLPTPLRKTPRIHHVSSMEHASFDPALTTPCSTPQTSPRPVCRCLSFHSADCYTPDSSPKCSEDKEEDFQMVPLDDEHWTSEETPERTLCIHVHGLPHGLCPYPCPYANYQMPSYMDSLDLSDISDYEDYMVTFSNEDIPEMEEMPY